MKFFATVRVTKSFRRGSALLLALVLTIALFIMGLVFVSTTQIEKETVSRVDELQTLDTAVDTVIGRINTVLVGDLFGDDSDMLNNDASDEYYDYPGPDDPWLASLEPMDYSYNGTLGDFTDDYVVWRHITDLYGNFDGVGTNDHPCTAGAGAWYYSPKDRSIAAQWDSTSLTDSFPHAINYTVGNYYFVGRIVGEYEGTETILDGDDWANPSVPEAIWPWGAQADADGDGVADSRWVKVPNLTGPRGQNVYTAVRIIDNGGMININTAYRYPDPTHVTNGTPQWDGSQLSHINLQGIISQTDLNNGLSATTIQKVRYGIVVPTVPDDTHYDYDTKYETEVAQRILNPLTPIAGENYLPFDISDELELRNRFFLNSSVATCLGYRDDSLNINICQATFKPGTGDVGKELPYTIGDNLGPWYDKLKPDIDQGGTSIGDYNRRFFSTTYSFDRVIAPKPNNWDTDMPADLIAAWKKWTDWNKASDEWSYRPVCVNDYDSSASDPCALTIEQIAAAIWLGLPDNADLILNSQMGELNWTGTNERDRLACQLAVNMIDYIDNDSDITKLTVDDNDYYGYESQWGNVFITRVGVTKYDPAAPLGGVDVIRHYAIVLHNPGPSDVSLEGWTIYNQGQSDTYNIPGSPTVTADGVFVLIDDDGGSGHGFQASDFSELGKVTVVNGMLFSDDDVLVLLDNQGRPSDKITVKNITLADPAAVGTKDVLHSGDRAGNKYIGFDPSEIYVWESDLPGGGIGTIGSLETPSALPAAKVTADIQTNTLDSGEVENVAELYKSLMIGAMKFSDDYITMSECWDKFIQADGDDDILAEDIHKGRPDTADPCFVNLTRYLTVFHPFSDTVDNDGDGETDENSELAVAGRININTAPWFVIAQLPWVIDPAATAADEYKLARAIVAYRDMAMDPAGEINYSVQSTHTNWAAWVAAGNANKPRKFGMGLQDGDPDVREEVGFANIAELLNVTHNLKTGSPGSITYSDQEYYDIRRYGRDEDPPGTPKNNNDIGDGDPGPFYDEDEAANDLKERDVIFQRISNLVTVRSDVFTAYIMVRVGELGPQKRVIAIFDRSNVYNSGDTPKLVALHPVPDPR